MLKKIGLIMKKIATQIEGGIIYRTFVLIDILCERLFFGVCSDHYIGFEYYNKKRIERNRFLCGYRYIRLVSKCNGKDNIDGHLYFADKSNFNNIFHNYINRDWIDFKTVYLDEFQQFVKKHSQFIIKPRDKTYGIGVKKIEVKDNKDIKQLYEELCGEDIIAEEIINQHIGIGAFNISSVNTVRIQTLMNAFEEIRIIAAVLRMGRAGNVVDNFNFDGIVATIDIETGIVVTAGINKKGEKYYLHPDSGVQIIGYKLPNWEKTKDLVLRAAKVKPTVKYIGWDIAFNETGDPIIIEGNSHSGIDAIQISDQIGKWPLCKDTYDSL